MNLDRMADLYVYQLGHEPDETSNWLRARATLQYLTEAGIPPTEAFDVITASVALPSLPQFPDRLWQGSLLEPAKFYWHKQLRLQAPPETKMKDGSWNRPQWYLEMKIRYTIDDLLNYAYVTFGTAKVFRNEKRDLGMIRHLLERLGNWEICEPVDAVLAVIDKAADDTCNRHSLYTLQDFEEPAYHELAGKIAQAKLLGLDKIIWRTI